MSTVELNCQNFKCPSNTNGDCCQEQVHMMYEGPHHDRLRCIEAMEPDTEKVVMEDGVATREEGTDPSSK